MAKNTSKPQASGKTAESQSGLSAVVLDPGQIIDGISDSGKVRYEIKKYLGEGWTAVVYLGANLDKPGQQAALKFLRPNSDEITINSFRGEKAILSDIRRQGIICVPDVYGLFNEEQTNEFIEMEYISEEDYPRLDHLLELQGSLNEADALEIAHQALTLLDRLHMQVGRTYTDMQLKDFCWNAEKRNLMVMDWNHVSFERHVIEEGLKNNAPSVMQQLKGRGAKDFDDLARLDVLRFASYIYIFLTGKRTIESGETAWGLKTRAGVRWDQISESSRQILFKALVAYPGMSSYRTAAELLKDVESAVGLRNQKDYDALRDELGDVLDGIDDRDGEISRADPKIMEAEIKAWTLERLQQINRASALLDQIKRLPMSHSSDAILQKWLDRQSERIQTLYNEVPSGWATGLVYFNLEQYLTALDLWKPLAEQNKTVHLWRQVLLAKAATENANFPQMKDYLLKALEDLKSGNIDNLLKNFNSGAVVVVKGALAILSAEIEALQKIKQASFLDSFKDIDPLLKGAVDQLQLIKDADIQYYEILLRDPVWFSYVGKWLSAKQNEEFASSGKADLIKIIYEHRQSLKKEQQTASGQKASLAADIKFILGLLSDRPDINILKNRLWAQPDDKSLFNTLFLLAENLLSVEQSIQQALKSLPEKQAHLVDQASESGFGQLLDTLNKKLEGILAPVVMGGGNAISQLPQVKSDLENRLLTLQAWHLPLRQVISMTLKWGAPSETVEIKLRSRLFQLYADGYGDELDEAIRLNDWPHAEQAARMIPYFAGKQVVKIDVIRRLAEKFSNESKRALEDIANQELLIVNPRLDYLIHLDMILIILRAPDKVERGSQLNKISAGIGKQEERQKKLEDMLLTRQKNFDAMWQQHQDGLKNTSQLLARKTGISVLVTDFINEVTKEIGMLANADPQNYEDMVAIVKSHARKVREQYGSDPLAESELKAWMDSLQKYEESLEAIMGEQQNFKDFKNEAAECADAIARRDWNLAKPKFGMANSMTGYLKKEKAKGEQWCRDLDAALSGISQFTSDFKDASNLLEEFIHEFNTQYGKRVELNIITLLRARTQCNKLLEIEERHSREFAEFSPSFAYNGLKELDQQISDWQRLISFARILAVGKEPEIIIESQDRKITVAGPVNGGGEKDTGGNKKVWKSVLLWGFATIVVLGLFLGGYALLKPPIPGADGNAGTATANAISATNDAGTATSSAISATNVAGTATATFNVITPIPSPLTLTPLSPNTLIPAESFLGKTVDNGARVRTKPDLNAILIGTILGKTDIEIKYQCNVPKQLGIWFLIALDGLQITPVPATTPEFGWVNNTALVLPEGVIKNIPQYPNSADITCTPPTP